MSGPNSGHGGTRPWRWVWAVAAAAIVLALACWFVAPLERVDDTGADAPPTGSADLPSAEPSPAPPAQPNGATPARPRPRPPTADGGGATGAELDRILERLERGSFAFNVPEAMRAGERFRVRALLQPGVDVDALRDLLARETGRIEIGREVRIANIMQAQLEGSAFRIDPREPVESPVSRSEPTEWLWWVEALAAGRQTLRLSLYVKVTVDGQERARRIKTFERTVEVAVAPKTWIEWLNDALDPWQKLLGALAAFAGAAWGLYTWWKKRREKSPPDKS